MHAKTVLCDNWVSIGSSNLDQWNLRWNLEANQEIDDSNFAGEIQQILEEDFTKCHQFTYSEWRRRAPYLRLMEWFWRRIGLLIIKLTDRIKSKR
jgi:phosphatidylserine/phosphatidylglycerophosphate/cardiolipin synthase-like enzyme